MQNSSSSNKPLLIAVGNPLKGDDAVGIEIGKMLKSKMEVIFVYQSPDAFVSKIKKTGSKEIFFVDAAIFDGDVGDVKILSPSECFLGSTHTISFDIIEKMLKPSNVHYIGVNICKTEYSTSISHNLAKKLPTIANSVEKLIFRIFNNKL